MQHVCIGTNLMTRSSTNTSIQIPDEQSLFQMDIGTLKGNKKPNQKQAACICLHHASWLLLHSFRVFKIV